MKQKNNSGFTLVELLVVMSIIGFLASSSVYLINSTRMDARDSRRLADVKTIQKALEMYYSDNLKYPPVNQVGWTSGASNPLKTILTPNYLPVFPFDPKGLAYYYDSDPGDSYQTYGLMVFMEHPKNIAAFANNTKDKGHYNTWYEAGDQPMYCENNINCITWNDKYWWSVDSVCAGCN